ncbi:hypothetical protein N7468_006114 [Penicillium chermesinum]|uniref:Catalase core domain-containing protein n=1 Tax=Penicillium chermesinum TaxID=63820 RepID=A0A9W9P369_9EURO|nr:uncharacterized protein N7468_006114 [Penicillium chermesinum]KAJ5233158.1 hypothetical protein N7468_006114 [Penicillium chermesinum]KAJ6172794.1 hypothetical protein N7470_001861 [Penicillium chermesinum]
MPPGFETDVGLIFQPFRSQDGTFHYATIHVKSQQGVQYFSREEATRVAGEDPDYMIRDIFKATERGDSPDWSSYDEPKRKFCPSWRFGDEADVNQAQNYFADIEEAAFSPSTMVPGFAASAGPVLQARLFAYPNTVRYRLGRMGPLD